MVQNTRKTPGFDAIQPVNNPETVNVREDSDGQPLAVRLGRWQNIASIKDNWRIDDEWWRGDTISRLYYEVLTAQGRCVIIFKDLRRSLWYRQNYA